MAASTWKQQTPARPGSAARPNISDFLARAEDKTPPIPARLCALTSREQQILQLLAEGLAATAIARRLYISLATVRNHTQHILAKLGMHSKLEAVAYAYRRGLIKPPLQD